MEFNTDLSLRAAVRTEDVDWVASPLPGVDRRMLERVGEDGARRATSIVRYRPGSRFSPHLHPAGEEFLVLDGVFSDELGDYPAGTYVRNPPGSRHAPHSAPGTVIFVKLQQIAPDDDTRVVIDTGAGAWRPGPTAGVEVLPLHAHGGERIFLERWRPGTRRPRSTWLGGREVLVLDGAFEDEAGRYPKGTWLRLPAGADQAASSAEGCRLYVKEGHLARG